MNWPALVLLIPGAMFGALLVYGLKTGRMPAGKASPVAKTDDPTSYWGLGLLWGLATLGSIVWTVVKLVRS